MLNKEQNFFTVKDVAAASFIRAYADHLKKANKLKVPSWTEWTTTSTANELAPTDPDWVYLRVAAIARKVYLKPHTGVSTLRHIFGSVKRRGCLRNIHEHAHGKFIRWSLQQLEELKALTGNNKSNTNNQQNSAGCCPCCTLTFWRRYFDVTEGDVAKRLRSALFLTPSFCEIMEGHPDLYGPFWIYTTIVVILSISSNICSYLHLRGSQTLFNYDFNFVSVAASLVYGIGILTPIVLWCVVKLLFKVKIKLIQTICLYGYSETCFIIISCLLLIPSTVKQQYQYILILQKIKKILQWVLIAYGMIVSSTFFFRNIKKEMDELDSNQKYVVFAIVLGFQSVLCLTFKFYFFRLIKIPDTPQN
ncbi:Yip1 domain protein [Ichthyophthirius multifiliis]|uniref:Protein YIPF n=1 Tax=Ichthyophthirius multifiliis TaxID=5932 RepID=G0R683_ICHMU|nr:Yip1 domain protein [Ichthyophthirius multifiliis]EGR27010.1 Yip1 domain protein [Ichthyophthirius multifiliis]|eukprot:XP_004023894.1 Yip1 domain protein [Ichthyophthirius multifiliis]